MTTLLKCLSFTLILTSLNMFQSNAAMYSTLTSGSWDNTTNVWSLNGITPCSCAPSTTVSGDAIRINHNIVMTENLEIILGSIFTVSTSGSLSGPSYDITLLSAGTVVNLNGPVTVSRLFNGFPSLTEGATLNIRTILNVQTQCDFYDGNVNLDFGYLHMTIGGNYRNWDNSTFTMLNGSKVELFGGNIVNYGNIGLCATCCMTSEGNWTNNAPGVLTG
ncbi:MAG TPA: hypothetical protein EYO58_09315, partial [Flavobacteriales bacterium]|nr:hypothetical protein [Flavobacteriales bacterium]